MSKAASQAFSSYWRKRTVLSFRERYRLTVFVSNGTVAVMAQREVSLKSVLTCYEKNKMIFFFIWAVIDFVTINISWFLLNIKQHPSPISRKPQTVLNVWMAWIVCIVLFSYHKCACPMSRAIAATFWPRGRRALRARRPRGPNVKKWPAAWYSCQPYQWRIDLYESLLIKEVSGLLWNKLYKWFPSWAIHCRHIWWLTQWPCLHVYCCYSCHFLPLLMAFMAHEYMSDSFLRLMIP